MKPAALPSGGTWVITGGLGGLGLIFARALVGSGARVGLVGRRAPDERLAAELAGLGIAWALGDVSDRGSLAAALDKLRDRLGAFTGVIHAAGVLRDALVSGGVDAASVAAVLAPKVMGATNLDALTRNDPLEAFVVFSSVSARFGNVGQAAYGYANGWLNGFASGAPGPHAVARLAVMGRRRDGGRGAGACGPAGASRYGGVAEPSRHRGVCGGAEQRAGAAGGAAWRGRSVAAGLWSCGGPFAAPLLQRPRSPCRRCCAGSLNTSRSR